MIILTEYDTGCVCECGCRFIAQKGDIIFQKTLNGQDVYYTNCPKCGNCIIFYIDSLEQVKSVVEGEISQKEEN